MLDTFPNEILLLILAYFPTRKNSDFSPLYHGYEEEYNQKVMASLCLVSKSLRALAQPLLYQTYAVAEVQRGPVEPHNPHANKKLRSFLRTIITRPDLASCVENVRIKEWATEDFYRDTGMKPECPNKELQRLYLESARNFELGSDHYSWIASLLVGVEDAEVALLLALVSNVKQLVIEVPSSENGDIWEFYIEQVFAMARGVATEDTGVSFPRLQSIHIYGHPDADYGERARFAHFPFLDALLLPGLEHFYVDAATTYDTEATRQMLQNHTSSVTKLELSQTDQYADDIEVILRSCPKLKHLTIGLSSGKEIDFEGSASSWPELFQALTCRKDTLEHLRLEGQSDNLLAHIPTLAPGDQLGWPLIASLQCFTKLRYLLFAQVALLGVPTLSMDEVELECPLPLSDILPLSLETLVWGDVCNDFGLQKLDILASTIETRLPNLRTIVTSEFCPLPDDWVDPYDDDDQYLMGNGEKVSTVIERVEKNLKAAGVEWLCSGW